MILKFFHSIEMDRNREIRRRDIMESEEAKRKIHRWAKANIRNHSARRLFWPHRLIFDGFNPTKKLKKSKKTKKREYYEREIQLETPPLFIHTHARSVCVLFWSMTGRTCTTRRWWEYHTSRIAVGRLTHFFIHPFCYFSFLFFFIMSLIWFFLKYNVQ